jgi:NADPH:quinone reductase-like Zn-dependent oxidoreductase
VTHRPDPVVPPRMRAVRLHAPGGPEALRFEEIETPRPGRGEVLVRVLAAAITRDELTWPVDRLPAIPSYELSGVVATAGSEVEGVTTGDAVFALTGFDRDGAAAEYAAVPARYVAPRPATLSDVEAAAAPLPGLTAWQGLFQHGRLEAGQRVLIHGAAGGVGHLATQLARWRGAHVIGTVTDDAVDAVRELGAQEALDRDQDRFEDVLEPVDLVLDTVGGEVLARSAAAVRPGGRLVSVAEEPPEIAPERRIEASYFVVEPNGDQLAELGRLIDSGQLRPAVDAVFPLADARAAFERTTVRGKRGKIVLRVGGHESGA